MDSIKSYTVRRPGETYWSANHKSLRAAIREKDKANRQVPGHQVYAEHTSGNTTGPYTLDITDR